MAVVYVLQLNRPKGGSLCGTVEGGQVWGGLAEAPQSFFSSISFLKPLSWERGEAN